mgnify:CR=1 FL=1
MIFLQLESVVLNEIKKDAQARMSKSVDGLKNELTTLRTGRASTGLVGNLKVNYYGSDMPLNQVATVTVADARSITITPWEKPMVAAVEKAILASNLGFTPNTLGQVIRINLPPLTEERRKELIKHVYAECENAKISVRNIRRDAISSVKDLLKDKTISEDDARRGEDDIQKITDKSVKDIDDIGKTKEQELLAV